MMISMTVMVMMMVIAVVVIKPIAIPTTTSTAAATAFPIVVVMVVVMVRVVARRSVDLGGAGRGGIGVEDFEVVRRLDVLQQGPGARVVLLARPALHELGLC